MAAKTPPFVVVVPARYASTRLPGKPLLPIGGLSMVRRVAARAASAGAAQVVVATDDTRVASEMRGCEGDILVYSVVSAPSKGTP